jgi:hypothetical protein
MSDTCWRVIRKFEGVAGPDGAGVLEGPELPHPETARVARTVHVSTRRFVMAVLCGPLAVWILAQLPAE